MRSKPIDACWCVRAHVGFCVCPISVLPHEWVEPMTYGLGPLIVPLGREAANRGRRRCRNRPAKVRNEPQDAGVADRRQMSGNKKNGMQI